MEQNKTLTPHLKLAQQVTDQFKVFPQVEAIGLAGSLTGGSVDPESDIDMYIYTTALIPLEERVAIRERLGGATRADMNLQFWDLGDEWYHAPTGIEIDLMYWDVNWVAEQINRVVAEHQASVGYTTCHWHTIHNSRVMFDRTGWFQALKARCDVPFPEPLRRAIIAKNHPLLRRVIPAYLHQIEKALRRADWVSVNHRVAEFFASYFDVVWALNRQLHPGEKRLVTKTLAHCANVPVDMAAQIDAVLRAAAPPGKDLVAHIEALVDNLDVLLQEEGFNPDS